MLDGEVIRCIFVGGFVYAYASELSGMMFIAPYAYSVYNRLHDLADDEFFSVYTARHLRDMIRFDLSGSIRVFPM